MNDKSKTEKNSFQEMSEKEFQQILEEQERLYEEPFVDEALEEFVRKPEELNLFISVTHFFPLFFLFCVICACSIISGIKGWMEPFVAVPIAFLSMIGIVVLAIDAKKNDEENNKK